MRIDCITDLDLERVEKALKKAMMISRAKGEAALPSGNKFDPMDPLAEWQSHLYRTEKEAGRRCGELLALLYLQSGRSKEAAKILVAMGYHYRLGESVFRYPLKDADGKTTDDDNIDTVASAVDGALCSQLLEAMREAFRPQATFWKEHQYDPFINCSKSVGYFSYLYHFKDRGHSCLPEQCVDAVFRYVEEKFPEQAKAATVAEWWVHTRPHSCGHQLHFDSDETYIEDGGKPTHPLLSCIVYLEEYSDSNICGGSTLITNQTLGGALATKGWHCVPKSNRMLIFDAKYLHGVIPGRGLGPADPSRRRLSFMIGFWRDIKSRQLGRGNHGAGQLLPSLASPVSSSYTSSSSVSKMPSWEAEMPPLSSVDGSDVTELRSGSPAPLLEIQNVWEQVDSTNIAPQPNYESCFQGF